MTPQAAVSLANWLQFEHPVLFQALLQHVAPGLAGLGQDDGTETITVSAPDLSVTAPDLSTIDTSSFTTPTLDTAPLPSIDTTPVAPSTWDTIANGVSSAVGAVGSFLGSSQGISSLTNLATAY
jgi:hypothetical protein